MQAIDNALTRIENALAALSLISVFVMMLLVSADAVSRYLFNAPLQVQYEFTTYYLMVISILPALSWTYRMQGHIRVNLLELTMPTGVRVAWRLISLFLSFLLFAAITWYSGIFAYEVWADGDALFGVIDWPVWLARIWVPLGTGVLSLRLAFDLIETLIAMGRGDSGALLERIDAFDEIAQAQATSGERDRTAS